MKKFKKNIYFVVLCSFFAQTVFAHDCDNGGSGWAPIEEQILNESNYPITVTEIDGGNNNGYNYVWGGTVWNTGQNFADADSYNNGNVLYSGGNGNGVNLGADQVVMNSTDPDSGEWTDDNGNAVPTVSGGIVPTVTIPSGQEYKYVACDTECLALSIQGPNAVYYTMVLNNRVSGSPHNTENDTPGCPAVGADPRALYVAGSDANVPPYSYVLLNNNAVMPPANGAEADYSGPNSGTPLFAGLYGPESMANYYPNAGGSNGSSPTTGYLPSGSPGAKAPIETWTAMQDDRGMGNIGPTVKIWVSQSWFSWLQPQEF